MAETDTMFSTVRSTLQSSLPISAKSISSSLSLLPGLADQTRASTTADVHLAKVLASQVTQMLGEATRMYLAITRVLLWVKEQRRSLLIT